MIKEAIVLAGGLGTRLKEAVPHLPKCMAPVAGRPFIAHVIDYLRMQGIERFIFSLGYKYELITDFLEDYYPTLQYKYIIEDEPLGTGGAIQLAMQAAEDDHLLVTNGDTLFKIDSKSMAAAHFNNNAQCTLALKPMQNFDRYGIVTLDEKGCVQLFREKQFYIEGMINGGVYILNKKEFLAKELPQKFSFENDYLERFYKSQQFYGSVQQGYFIDIGVPEDYAKAQADLALPILNLKNIDAAWTLFLDRDGVINMETLNEYVLSWKGFVFSEGVLKAFPILNRHFGRVILITNQRGISKGLMTEEDLNHIHTEMEREIRMAGGHIDKIYYCTSLQNKHTHRKPNPGMALQAVNDYTDIDLTKAVMVGNKPGDMRFGRAAGMHTVFIASTNPEQPYPHPDIDFRFNSLPAFAQAL